MRTSILLALTLAACNGDQTYATNTAPVADAGADVIVPADQPVTLDGRASYDADGNPITYHWTFDHVPEGSALPERQAPFHPNHGSDGVTTFSPDAVGIYLVELRVHDGQRESEPSFVLVTAGDPEVMPVANAGPDLTVDLGTTVEVDGRASSDPLGGSLAYTWSLSDAPYNSVLTTASMTGADASVASFTPDVAGDYTVSLVVANTMSSSAADSIAVTVTGENLPPVADAGADAFDFDCTTQVLDASASSDPEGARLSYFWELQEAPADSRADGSNFEDRSAAVTDFWPDVAGTYLLSVSAFDGELWSEPDFVTLDLSERLINSAPLVSAGSDRIESMGTAECTHDGGWVCQRCTPLEVDLGSDGSITDVDGDPVEVYWTVLEGTASLTSDDTLETSAFLDAVVPSQAGACTEETFRFQLTATDCPGLATVDRIVILGECCGVVATP